MEENLRPGGEMQRAEALGTGDDSALWALDSGNQSRRIGSRLEFRVGPQEMRTTTIDTEMTS